MAAQSKTDLCNLALSLLGDDPISLTNVDTDTSKAGKLCQLYIDNCRKGLLRAFIWNFAKKRATLTLGTISNAANNGSGLIRITKTSHGFSTGNMVGLTDVVGTTEANGIWTITVIDANNFDLQGSTFNNTYVSGGYVSLAPAFEYRHQQTLPAGFLRLVLVQTPNEDAVDYQLEGSYIVCNEPIIETAYIEDISDYTKFDPLFYQAFAHSLAILMCYSLTQSIALKNQLKVDFKELMMKARHTDAVEDPQKFMNATAWLSERVGMSSSFVRDPMT